VNGVYHRLKPVANNKTAQPKRQWNPPILSWTRSVRVHDILRGLYSELRRVNVGFFLELAIDHQPTRLRLTSLRSV